jgi:MFS family permease
MTKERLWTKDFTIVAVINFLIYIVFFLLMVVMASHAVDKYHASAGMGGLVSGIFVFGILVGRLGTGRIIADVGSRRILIAGTLFFIVTSALYLAAASLPLLIAVRFLHGIAFGVAGTATGTIAAQVIPRGRHGEGIGWYTMSQIMATALGPYLGIVMSRRVDFSVIFIVASVVAAVGFVISLVVTEPARSAPPPDKAKEAKGFQVSNFLEFKAIPISIIVLIVGFGYSIVMSFISLYSRQIHLEEAASFFFLVYAVTVIASRPVSGRLLDCRGANFVVYPILLLFAIGMFLLSQAGGAITLLLSAVIMGLGYGNFLSCGQAISVMSASPHRFGLATATYYMFLDVGFGIGPYLFGSLVPFTGYRGLYMVMALIILSTIVLYYFLVRKRVSPEKAAA